MVFTEPRQLILISQVELSESFSISETAQAEVLKLVLALYL